MITFCTIAGRAIQASQSGRRCRNVAAPASRRQQTRERGKAAGRTRGVDLVKAQAAATAVIAFAAGGAAETVPGLVTEASTGVMFGTQATSAIVATVDRFAVHAQRSAAAACGSNVARFALRALLAKVSSSRPGAAAAL